ncbi:CidA/LrgA family holin-like protein [Priestia filamentosa]|uniref:CidA/LrgA family protein n=1 Tax=Priestia filamentosa TaxID=1402861 RepID=UPI00397BDEFD
MKRFSLIALQILFLYFLYKCSTFIASFFHLPIPGSIVGMLILFLLLQFKLIQAKWVSEGANWLLSYLSLLFVPATVGIIDYLSFFASKGILTIFIVIISTFLVMMTAGLLTQYFARKQERVTRTGEREVSR